MFYVFVANQVSLSLIKFRGVLENDMKTTQTYFCEALGCQSIQSIQSTYPIGTKNIIIRSPALQILYMRFAKIGFLSSEKMLF